MRFWGIRYTRFSTQPMWLQVVFQDVFFWTTPDFIQTFCSSFCGFSPILDSKVSLVQCTFHREPKGNGAREASSRFVCKDGIKPQETVSFLCEKYEIMITIKFWGSQFSDKAIFTSRCSECVYSNVYPNIRTTLAYICVARSYLVSGAIISIVSEILVTFYIINRPS